MTFTSHQFPTQVAALLQGSCSQSITIIDFKVKGAILIMCNLTFGMTCDINFHLH